ncbi:MAG: DUF2160 family membrane protein [Pseudomonadota bacterium]
MAWTAPTAAFFALIALAIVVLTLIELKWPTSESQGWLPIATTRGDRFFISLLLAAYVHLSWLALIEASAIYASLLSLTLAVLVMRWG